MTTITESPITTIAEVGRHDGQSVTIRGWLYNKRESGKLIFPIFRDGTGTIQGVVPKNQVTPEVFDTLKNLTDESSVIVTGKVRADKRAPGGYELDDVDEEAFLTQSGQLYIEATAMALGKVYSFGPTFRAEKSKTRRHLTEFWMVEPEIAYAELDDIMELAENFISHVVQSALTHRRSDLETIGRDVSKLQKVDAPFPRLAY